MTQTFKKSSNTNYVAAHPVLGLQITLEVLCVKYFDNPEKLILNYSKSA